MVVLSLLLLVVVEISWDSSGLIVSWIGTAHECTWRCFSEQSVEGIIREAWSENDKNDDLTAYWSQVVGSVGWKNECFSGLEGKGDTFLGDSK